jgi:hypothetical protein
VSLKYWLDERTSETAEVMIPAQSSDTGLFARRNLIWTAVTEPHERACASIGPRTSLRSANQPESDYDHGAARQRHQLSESRLSRALIDRR